MDRQRLHDEALVAEATTRATQAIAAKNRHRLMYSGLIVGLIVGGLIGAFVGAWVSSDNAARDRQVARRDAIQNCEVSAQARPQGNARAFSQVAFFDVLEDALHPKGPQTSAEKRATRAFAAKELLQINTLANGWRPYTATPRGNELPAKITGFAQLAATTHPVHLLHCHSLIGG